MTRRECCSVRALVAPAPGFLERSIVRRLHTAMLSANHARFKTRSKQWLWAATAVAALLGALHVSTQGAPPPILLVVNSASANPYGSYLGEILKAEGLSSFAVAQLSTVTPTTLNNAQVVVLAETPLSPSESVLFSN